MDFEGVTVCELSDILSGLDLVVFCVIPRDLWVFEVVVPPPFGCNRVSFFALGWN